MQNWRNCAAALWKQEINIYHQHISTGSEKPDGKLVENMEKLFAEFCGIIGVLETSAQPAAEKDASLEDKLIETVVSLRQEARAAKNYAQADALRNALTGLGIVLEDTALCLRTLRREYGGKNSEV